MAIKKSIGKRKETNCRPWQHAYEPEHFTEQLSTSREIDKR